LLNGVNAPRKLLLQQSFIDDFLRISQLQNDMKGKRQQLQEIYLCRMRET
jgi:hypothetical protein